MRKKLFALLIAGAGLFTVSCNDKPAGQPTSADTSKTEGSSNGHALYLDAGYVPPFSGRGDPRSL